MTHRPSRILVGFAAFVIACAAANGQPARTVPREPDAGAIAERVKLSDLRGSRLARLVGASSGDEIPLSVSRLVEVTAARLVLRMTHSTALMSDRSVFWVSLNGPVQSQMQLRREEPAVVVEIPLNTALLAPGFNRLRFDVAQHYTNECEDAFAPELWTEVDLDGSYLEVTYRRRPAPLSVAELSDLISPSIGGLRHLQLLVGDRPAVGADEARWGSWISVAAGLRLGYVPPQLESAPLPRVSQTQMQANKAAGWYAPGLDQPALGDALGVLLGTREQLRPVLSDAASAEITGSFVALRQRDDSPTHYLLVVSGTTTAEVDQAARALGLMDFPFVGSDSTTIRAIEPSAKGVNPAHPVLQAGVPHSLRELGSEPIEFRRALVQAHRVPVQLPVDVVIGGNGRFAIDLDFAYAGGLRSDSVLNFYVNDRFEAAIPLQAAGGAVVRGYRLDLSLSAFRRGGNTLTFEGVLMPAASDKCLIRQPANLLLTVFENSTVTLAEASGEIAQPDLELFGRTGFPYVRGGDTSYLRLRIAEPSRDSAIAAWLLMGRLAQVTRSSLQGAELTMGQAPGPNDEIVVGSTGALDADVRNAIGLDAESGLHRFPYPALWSVEERRGPSWLERIVGPTLVSIGIATPPALRNTGVIEISRIVQSNGLGRNGILFAVESPSAPHHTTTVLTARDPATLAAAAERLVRPAFWSQIQGRLMLWRETPAEVATLPLPATYAVGEVSVGHQLGFAASRHPLVWLGLVGLVILALAAVVWIVVWRIRSNQ